MRSDIRWSVFSSFVNALPTDYQCFIGLMHPSQSPPFSRHTKYPSVHAPLIPCPLSAHSIFMRLSAVVSQKKALRAHFKILTEADHRRFHPSAMYFPLGWPRTFGVKGDEQLTCLDFNGVCAVCRSVDVPNSL